MDLYDEIYDYSMGMLAKIFMADTEEEFEALYKEAVETRKSMGIDTLIDWFQNEVDGYVAAWDAANAG